MSSPATDAAHVAADTPRPRALLLWRLLAMIYDALPVLALWMLAGTAFTLAYTFSGHAQRDNIAPFSAWQWLLWAVCWAPAASPPPAEALWQSATASLTFLS